MNIKDYFNDGDKVIHPNYPGEVGTIKHMRLTEKKRPLGAMVSWPSQSVNQRLALTSLSKCSTYEESRSLMAAF
jgi:hypothetical protein